MRVIFKSFSFYHQQKMANYFDVIAYQMYQGVINKKYTIQDFIDFISNRIDNNQIISHLLTYLQETQEINYFYNLEYHHCSPRFEKQYIDNQGHSDTFEYYIKKPAFSYHFCLYISIPANHPLNGHSYEKVLNATYSGVDDECPERWVFGWDYSHTCMLTLTNIYLQYAFNYVNINGLLDKKIITKNSIEDDLSSYINILSSNILYEKSRLIE